MKRSIKKITVLCLAVLMLLLTGCDALDYREALELYNTGLYAQAADKFAALADYEDSAALYTRSRYWMALEQYNRGEYTQAGELFAQLGTYEDSAALSARCQYNLAVETMERKDFQAAIAQFTALDGFEDSAQRITECQYQLALTAFQAEDYTAAEPQFAALGDYRNSGEYLRQMGWLRFFDWVCRTGEADGTAFILASEYNGQPVRIIADTAQQQLRFFTGITKDAGYTFTDELTLQLTQDSSYSSFTAISTFTMELSGNEIGTTQQSTGRLDILTCTADTVLSVEAYSKTGTDNHGNAISSQDPAESTMYSAMTQNFQLLMEALPQLLTEQGAEVTMQDLGFPA